MKNTVWTAKLLDQNIIRVTIFSTITKPCYYAINLVKDDKEISGLTIVKSSTFSGLSLYDCKAPYEIELGHKYNVVIESFGSVPLDINDLSMSSDFDDKYFYDGNDLGANYNPSYTEFVLWAPLASNVILKIKDKNDENFSLYQLNRESKGVYRLKLCGNHDEAIYNYLVENSGVTKETIDPYAKGSTPNGVNSVVINPKRIKIDLEEDDLPIYENYTDTIIYELHVRDFTIDKNTNIKNKGKYLGLAEDHRTTTNGNPAGLDYLKYLGITHVQLLPIYDYKTVDELNSELPNNYNWGYDPWQYFVPEGSYASDVFNPYSRIIDLKKMIKALHHNGIKVVQDVVYNHVYNYQFHPLEDIVPNYYFRRSSNNLMSNGSFCGNDLASDRKMCSKLIVDACLYWIKEYGIDGFRFDLMGIVDKHTMNKINREAKLLKPDFILYGEGWNMPTALNESLRTSQENAMNLPKISFFNDTYRDVAKGSTSESNFYQKGYLTGDTSYIEGFKYVYMGCCVNYCYNKKYLNANQSINYVECHDNATIYDKVLACGFEDDKDILRVIKMINASILFSYGVPFFHMGQEIGLSKNMHQNTYNKGDKYNRMRYDVLDERFQYVNILKSIIQYRKENKYLRLCDSKEIDEMVDFENLNNGVLKIDFSNNISLILNPTSEPYYYTTDEVKNIIIGDAGYLPSDLINVKSIIVSPNSFNLFKKEEAK